ncbi:MAG: primosomal protein N' [Elusimicrobia bacterium]|nr:primosomal protein N' [Elusimicrobiota bacterium]
MHSQENTMKDLGPRTQDLGPALVAEVAFPLPLYKTFHYLIPPSWESKIAPGSRVLAPFGPQRKLAGFVLSIMEKTAQPTMPLKEIIKLLDPQPVLSEELLNLAAWLSDRYCAPPGEALKMLLPNVIKSEPLLSPQQVRLPDSSATSLRQLTPDQQKALEVLLPKLTSTRFEVALLYGVPASGKTEVYLQLMKAATEKGGQALFLVPEISLTQPFIEEISKELRAPLIAWHSSLSAALRRRAWWELAHGNAQIVVGARSACLLPFHNLRLIVIDEEQDESYKHQGRNPLYHARDILLHRAKKHSSLVLLGSATPSLESYHRASSGQCLLLSLENRVSETTPPPTTRILSMVGKNALFHEELISEIQLRLEKKEQVIILINRRGFAHYVLCQKCGWIPTCDSCGTVLVLHEASPEMLLCCHHCIYKKTLPSSCPKCGAGSLRHSGTGTQRAVQQLKSYFPQARILRLDRDSLHHKKEEGHMAYEKFKEKQADILVGTKLVSKGFHFPEVTLVGVIHADALLFFPDFRASEKTAQLLFQVAGRAGRAQKPGLVLIQTTHPEHPVIQAFQRGDYLHFLKEELRLREELRYPPTSHLIRLTLSSAKKDLLLKEITRLAENLKNQFPPSSVEILGPAPAVYKKLRGNHRYHLLAKIGTDKVRSSFLQALQKIKPTNSLKLKIDVDPYDLF